MARSGLGHVKEDLIGMADDADVRVRGDGGNCGRKRSAKPFTEVAERLTSDEEWLVRVGSGLLDVTESTLSYKIGRVLVGMIRDGLA